MEINIYTSKVISREERRVRGSSNKTMRILKKGELYNLRDQ
jgi:hypothetical protein